jgi:hypothetical protein
MSLEILSKILKEGDYKRGFLMGFRMKIPPKVLKAENDDFCHLVY